MNKLTHLLKEAISRPDCPDDLLESIKNMKVSHYYVPTYVVDIDLDLTVRAVTHNSSGRERDYRQFSVFWSRNVLAATDPFLTPYQGFINTAFSTQKLTVEFDGMELHANQNVLKKTVSQGAAKHITRELLRDKNQFAAERDKMAEKMRSERGPQTTLESCDVEFKASVSNDDLCVVYVPFSIFTWKHHGLPCTLCAAGTSENNSNNNNNNNNNNTVRVYYHQFPSVPVEDLSKFTSWGNFFILLGIGLRCFNWENWWMVLSLGCICLFLYVDRHVRAEQRNKFRLARLDNWFILHTKGNYVNELNARS